MPRSGSERGSLLIAVLSALLPAIPAAGADPVEAVPDLELERYAGRWYETARYPQFFQRNCAGDVTAEYTLQDDGQVRVVNRCLREDGREIDARGVARRVDPDGPASRLEVRFAPRWLAALPFVWGDYWVIALDPEYHWAVVGAPSRKYLWILSRTPQLHEDTHARILEGILAQGYDPSRLTRTQHSAAID